MEKQYSQKASTAEDFKESIHESELIINPDGSIFHLHVKPEQTPGAYLSWRSISKRKNAMYSRASSAP